MREVWERARVTATGSGYRLLMLGGTSFLGGVAEAVILLIVVQIAVALTGSLDVVDLRLGPLGSRSFTVDDLFVLGFAIAFIRLGAQAWSAHQTAVISADARSKQRRETFDAFVHSRWDVQSGMEEGHLQDLVVEHVARASSAVVYLASGCSNLLNFVALMVSAFVINTTAAVAVVGAVVVLFFILRPATRRARRGADDQSTAGREYSRRVVELVSLMQEVRTFDVGDQVLREVDGLIDDELRPFRRTQFISRLIGPMYQAAAIVVLLVGLLAVHAFVEGQPTSLGATVLILIRAMNYSSAIQTSYHHIQELGPYVARLRAEQRRLLNARAVGGTADVGRIRSLAFERASYSYDGRRDALREVTFSVDAGEAIGIIGPSGSGKSTLVQLLLRLRDPTSGAYLVNDVPAATSSLHSWYRQVAFVPQDAHMMNSSVFDNIAFFRDVDEQAVRSAAMAARIHDDIESWDLEYATRIGPRGTSLSGGQRQRLALARALVGSPSLLVLDEPTSALDMQSEALVHATLAELKGTVTMFVIAHRLSTLRTCDRVLVLGEGRVQAFDSHENLHRDSEFYRTALELSQVR